MPSFDKGPMVVRTPGQEILTVRYLREQNGGGIVAGEEFCAPHPFRLLHHCTFSFPLQLAYSVQTWL